MNAADSVKSIKPVEPGLHGAPAPLSPAQLPFDIVLHAKAPVRPSASDGPERPEYRQRQGALSIRDDRQPRGANRIQTPNSSNPPQVSHRRAADLEDAPQTEPAVEREDDADQFERDETSDSVAVGAPAAIAVPLVPTPDGLPLDAAESPADGGQLEGDLILPPSGQGDHARQPAAGLESAGVPDPEQTAVADSTELPASDPSPAELHDHFAAAVAEPAADADAVAIEDAVADQDAVTENPQSESGVDAAVIDPVAEATANIATDQNSSESAAVDAPDESPDESGDSDDHASAEGESQGNDAPAPDHPSVPQAEKTAHPLARAADAVVLQQLPAEVRSPARGNSSTSLDAANPVPPAAPRPLPHGLSRGEIAPGRHARPIEVDAGRLIHRVARAFQVAQQRGGDLKLRLSPPELGSLRVELRVQDGVMTARLETETQSARAALVENLPALRERLAEQGIRIERFDVDLMQQQGQGQESGARDQGPPGENGRVGEWESRRNARPSAEAASHVPSSAPLPLTTASGLNVLV